MSYGEKCIFRRGMFCDSVINKGLCNESNCPYNKNLFVKELIVENK